MVEYALRAKRGGGGDGGGEGNRWTAGPTRRTKRGLEEDWKRTGVAGRATVLLELQTTGEHRVLSARERRSVGWMGGRRQKKEELEQVGGVRKRQGSRGGRGKQERVRGASAELTEVYKRMDITIGQGEKEIGVSFFLDALVPTASEMQ